MSERDWRACPVHGDVVQKTLWGEPTNFRVIEATGKARKIAGPGFVRIEFADFPDSATRSFCGTEWRKWAATAEIVRKAEG